MSEFVQILIAIVIVATLTISFSKRFRISKRYERQSRNRPPMNSWSALDHGIDPSEVKSGNDKP